MQKDRPSNTKNNHRYLILRTPIYLIAAAVPFVCFLFLGRGIERVLIKMPFFTHAEDVTAEEELLQQLGAIEISNMWIPTLIVCAVSIALVVLVSFSRFYKASVASACLLIAFGGYVVWNDLNELQRTIEPRLSLEDFSTLKLPNEFKVVDRTYSYNPKVVNEHAEIVVEANGISDDLCAKLEAAVMEWKQMSADNLPNSICDISTETDGIFTGLNATFGPVSKPPGSPVRSGDEPLPVKLTVVISEGVTCRQCDERERYLNS